MDEFTRTLINRWLNEDASDDDITALVRILGIRKREAEKDSYAEDILPDASDVPEHLSKKEDSKDSDDADEEDRIEDPEYDLDPEDYFYDPV